MTQMTDKERERMKSFVDRFWADPKNVEAFEKVHKKICDDLDISFFDKSVTTEEESEMRRQKVDWPKYELV